LEFKHKQPQQQQVAKLSDLQSAPAERFAAIKLIDALIDVCELIDDPSIHPSINRWPDHKLISM